MRRTTTTTIHPWAYRPPALRPASLAHRYRVPRVTEIARPAPSATTGGAR